MEKSSPTCMEVGSNRSINSDITWDHSSRIEDDVLTLFPFVCGICDEKFNSLPAYFSHIAVHEHVGTFLHCCNQQIKDGSDMAGNSFTCGICDIHYPTLCTLYKHLLDVEGVSDFVYRSKERKACPYHETSCNRDRNYSHAGNELGVKEISQSNKSIDRHSGDDSDATVIDEINCAQTADIDKSDMQVIGRKTKKGERKLKQGSLKKQSNELKVCKSKNFVKHKGKWGVNSSAIPRKQSPELSLGDLTRNKGDSGIEKIKRSLRKRKMEIHVNYDNSDTETTTASLHGSEDNIDGSSNNSDITDNMVKVEQDTVGKTKLARINRKNHLFPCDICGAVFKYQYLKKHRQTHEERTLPCDQCDNVYNCKFKLKTHKKQVHTDEMKFTCDECGKRFKAWPYLKQHRQVHIKERNIQCPVCPMKFKYAAVLRMHMKTHSDQKPYSCDQCDRKFRRADLLATHKKYHVDQKTFSCPECSKMFKVKQDVNKHFRIHLPPKFFCEVCGKGFVQKYNMKIHLKTHGVYP